MILCLGFPVKLRYYSTVTPQDDRVSIGHVGPFSQTTAGFSVLTTDMLRDAARLS